MVCFLSILSGMSHLNIQQLFRKQLLLFSKDFSTAPMIFNDRTEAFGGFLFNCIG